MWDLIYIILDSSETNEKRSETDSQMVMPKEASLALQKALGRKKTCTRAFTIVLFVARK